MRVVCIGGGKGLASVLQAWSSFDVELTAIVATTDNGGCSGRLRRAGSPVPWGDIRKALLAMTPQANPLATTLSHRLKGLAQLTGHCMGNLLLESLYQQTDSVCEAIHLMAEQLGVRGTVLPMCIQPIDLKAVMSDGKTINGEVAIDAQSSMPVALMLDRHVDSTPECINALKQADIVCIGPGSLLTSVMPALLLDDIQQTLARNRGVKVFIHNIAGEQSCVGNLGKYELEQWLFSQCHPDAINGVLNRSNLTINNRTYSLPVSLRNGRGDLACKHEISSLAQAFSFLLEKRKKKDFGKDAPLPSPLLRFKQLNSAC